MLRKVWICGNRRDRYPGVAESNGCRSAHKERSGCRLKRQRELAAVRRKPAFAQSSVLGPLSTLTRPDQTSLHITTSQHEFLPQFSLFTIISLSGPFAFHLIYSNLWLCLREFEFIRFSFFIRKGEVKSQFWGSMHLCHLRFLSKQWNQRLQTKKKKIFLYLSEQKKLTVVTSWSLPI